MDAKLRLVLGLPGEVTVKGRTLAVPPQTPADVARTHDAMRELARRDCTPPLLHVNALREQLDPVTLAEAVRAAVGMGSGGGVEPTREAVFRQYGTLDGVRWRLWYQAKKAEPGLTREDVAALVTEETVYDVADALDVALGLRALDPGKLPASGPSSS